MDLRELEKYLAENSGQIEMLKRICLVTGDEQTIKNYLYHIISGFLEHRLNNAGHTLEMIPDLSPEDLPMEEFRKGMKIILRLPHCNFVGIFEKVLMSEEQRKRYIH